MLRYCRKIIDWTELMPHPVYQSKANIPKGPKIQHLFVFNIYRLSWSAESSVTQDPLGLLLKSLYGT